ncbi:MAG: hypothetical protein ACRC0L_09855 [Angustibacter sp.]
MNIGPKPDPKAVRAYIKCDYGGLVLQKAVWQSPGQRAGAALTAQDGYVAVGRIAFPLISVGMSARESMVVIATPLSWWAQGAGTAALRGSSAAGLVAIATPDRLDVTTGEAGVAVKRCAFVVSAASAGSCVSEYVKSSVHGTQSTRWGPAYTAKVDTFYTISFELNGVPVTIPGFPTDWPGSAATAPLSVTEVQALAGPQQP